MEDGNFQLKKELEKASSPFQRNRIYPSTMVNTYLPDYHFTHGNKKLAMSLKQILKRFKMSELL